MKIFEKIPFIKGKDFLLREIKIGDTNEVITKAPIYAIERISAISKTGFVKTSDLLVGKNGYLYDGYWII